MSRVVLRHRLLAWVCVNGGILEFQGCCPDDGCFWCAFVRSDGSKAKSNGTEQFTERFDHTSVVGWEKTTNSVTDDVGVGSCL
ncbi:hypothetical protein B0T09DRAFT_345869, partial [Sordaria sp. MPI-SDFR-AT-0083]